MAAAPLEIVCDKYGRFIELELIEGEDGLSEMDGSFGGLLGRATVN